MLKSIVKNFYNLLFKIVNFGVNIVKVSSGIDELDEILGGGFFPGYIVLIAGHPGAGKTTLAAAFLYYGAKKHDEPGIYVSFSENKEEFYRHMETLGFDFDELEKEGKFMFIEAMTFASKEAISGLIDVIANTINELDAKRIVLDTVTALIGVLSPAEARAFLQTTLVKIVKPLKMITYLIADLPHGSETIGYGFEEFQSDVVLKMIIERAKGLARRKLVIYKTREMPVPFYEYEFTIGMGGVKIYIPYRREIKGSYKPSRITTGIPELDKMLGGGVFEGSNILISGPSGTGKTTILLNIALHQASQGKRVIYISFEESPEQLKTASRMLGYEPEKLDSLMIFSIGPGSVTPATIYDHYYKVVNEFKPNIVILDGLSALERFYPKEEYLILARNLGLTGKERGITTIFSTLYDVMSGEEIGLSTIADTVIALWFKKDDEKLARMMGILKMRGSWHDTAKRRITFEKGRVVIR